MNKESEKKLKDIYEANKVFKINGKKLDLSYKEFSKTIENLIKAFGNNIDENSIDECIGLIGAGFLAGYRFKDEQSKKVFI